MGRNNRCHENAVKFPQNILLREISSKSQEKPGISSKFVCVTFAQYCKLGSEISLLFSRVRASAVVCLGN